jgi:photosystem II stability/assembly factor-like uncharacterized protein
LFIDSSAHYGLEEVSSADCASGGGGGTAYGTVWTSQDLIPNITIGNIVMSNNGQYQIVRGLYFSEPDATTYVSRDYGENWTMNYYPMNSVSMSSNGQYQILAGLYYTDTTDDYGATWSTTDSTYLYPIAYISSSGQRWWRVEGSTIRVSEDYGENWNSYSSPLTTYDSVKVEFSDEGQYQLIADSGNTDSLYLSDDYGHTWDELTSLPEGNWSMLVSSNGQYMFAATSSTSYLSSNYGATWSTTSLSGYYFFAMSGNGRYMTAINVMDGNVYLSDDYGISWEATTLVGDSDSFVSISETGMYMTAAMSGNLYTSDDYGATWNLRESGDSWTAIAMSSDGRYRLIGTVSDTLYYSDH